MPGLMTSKTFDALSVNIYDSHQTMADEAAKIVAEAIRQCTEQQEEVNLLLATGNSQLRFLEALRNLADIPWHQANIFHLDEYVGISENHSASFARYIRERVVQHVEPAHFFPIRGDAPNSEEELARYAELLEKHPIDICCLGIGENGHVAFNEPNDSDPDDGNKMRLVTLDNKSREQQVGEGHFASMQEVPEGAFTVTMSGIFASRRLFVIVPEARKAEAVKRTLQGEIDVSCPASYLRKLSSATLFLDDASSELID